MPSRPKSKAKSQSTTTQRKYFKQILNAIDNMQLTLRQKLQSYEHMIHQSKVSNQKTVKALRTYSQTAANTPLKTKNYYSIDKKATQKVSRSRTETESPKIFIKFQMPKSDDKLMNALDGNKTPKRQKTQRKDKTDSPFRDKLNSPFSLGIFERSETLKKMQKSPDLVTNRENEGRQREVGIWQKWKQSKFQQKIKTSRHMFTQQPPVPNNSNEIERYYQMKLQKLELEETACKLQQQFQSCLMSKRNAPRLEQIHFRSRMSELSMRIASIREQQIRII